MSEDKLFEDILVSIKSMEKYLRILVAVQIKSMLEKELENKTNQKIYEMTGENTVREISEATGQGIATISRLWKRWESLGLVIKVGSKFEKSLAEASK